MKFAWILILVLLISHASHAAEYFPLVCRGYTQLGMYEAGGDPVWHMSFNRNPQAAGQKGEFLNQKSCAWVDRAVRNDEPTMISMPPKALNEVGGQAMIASCMNDAGCVFKIEVRRVDEGLPSDQFKYDGGKYIAIIRR